MKDSTFDNFVLRLEYNEGLLDNPSHEMTKYDFVVKVDIDVVVIFSVKLQNI